MRIETIAIDGFGQFHDERLSPAPGLTVVKGPNEAGKTTLLAFTRAMLFGLPRRGHYPALAGGKRGGWLDVVMDDGRSLRIERYGERGGDGRLRVVEADKDLGPGHLAAVLQGVGTSVYQNIFAFGLGELMRFETLKDDEVAARIYGAGLGTGGVSGLSVAGSLANQMEAWFKSAGSKPQLNVLLDRLDDIDRRLEGRDLPRAYAQAGARLDAVNEQLDELAARHEELATEDRRQVRLKDGWATWLELRGAQGEREALGDVHAFEPDVLERLSVIETRLSASERAVEAVVRERDAAAAKLEGAMVDEAALSQRDALEGLAQATRLEMARADERARAERELSGARAAVAASLAGLGAGWTMERLDAFDDSIAVKSEISGRFRTSLAKTEQAATAARDAHQAGQAQSEEATKLASTAAERVTELDEALADRAPAAARERSLRELQSLANDLAVQRRLSEDLPTDDLGAMRSSFEERRRDARELADALRSKQTAQETLPSLQAIDRDAERQAQRQYLLPAALGIGGVVVAIVLALMDVSLAASIVVATAGVGGAVAWILVLRRQGVGGSAATREQVEQQLADAEATIARLGPALELGDSPSPSDCGPVHRPTRPGAPPSRTRGGPTRTRDRCRARGGTTRDRAGCGRERCRSVRGAVGRRAGGIRPGHRRRSRDGGSACRSDRA